MFYSLFFFFKQKTAYEMRISDWSSDVCSSDLAAGHTRRGRPEALHLHHRPLQRQGRERGGDVTTAARPARPGPAHPRSARSPARRRPQDRDRKSVVSGKSGAVRVDLGGRRIIKKKKTRQRILRTSNKKY